MSLENRVVVITGAAGGLGRVVTKVLAAQGTRLALLGTHVDRLERHSWNSQ
ncbi:MAG TPA: SDR family NAD(P)-dependent oxidoreductase [Anaerolineae bacterium]|nr:SDR family NAD(P)-dependent oxidoreductase [Anaerolineae bacterium]